MSNALNQNNQQVQQNYEPDYYTDNGELKSEDDKKSCQT